MDMFRELGYKDIIQASNGEEAIDIIYEHLPDIITLDNILPDMLGIDILNVIREDSIDAKVIMISAVGNNDILEQASDLGAEYIIKPFLIKDLKEKLN